MQDFSNFSHNANGFCVGCWTRSFAPAPPARPSSDPDLGARHPAAQFWGGGGPAIETGMPEPIGGRGPVVCRCYL